eukprot:5050943-Prymnesium_polylepis.1
MGHTSPPRRHPSALRHPFARPPLRAPPPLPRRHPSARRHFFARPPLRAPPLACAASDSKLKNETDVVRGPTSTRR